jgi:hypothetical protein
MGYHGLENRNRDVGSERRRSTVLQHLRHVDWAMIALIALLVAVVTIPPIVAIWHFLS